MWPKLRHHAVQHSLYTDNIRFPVVQAGRGSGKTLIAKRFMVRQLPIIKPWESPMYAYALPTYSQAKRVAWDSILELIPKDWISKVSVSEMLIKTVFGSSLYIVGLDMPARIEGNQWDGIIEDECSDQRPGVFSLSIRPALSHKKGFCWRIGVPKRFGCGAFEFNEAFDYALEGNDPEVKAYTWPSEDILSPEEIIAVKAQISEVDYQEQYRASRQSISGLVYHSFDPVFNVISDATYRPSQPILVSSDFNVDPMSWCLGHVAMNGLVVFDEIRIKNTNTQKTLDALYEKYGSHQAGFIFIGDASSQARKTSATETDYAQIVNDARFANKQMAYHRSNPAIADRNASVNALFSNANKDRRLFINPRCEFLIKDLRNLSYKPGTREIQLSPMLGHMSDALGYMVWATFPLKVEISTATSSIVH